MSVRAAPSSRSRIVAYDLVRVVAIALVVLTHACQFLFFELGIPTTSSEVYAASLSLGRLGVPLFLMLSGALVAARPIDDAVGFWRRKLIPLLATCALWAVVYGAWLIAGFDGDGDGGLGLLEAAASVLLLQQLPQGLWWYVPMVLALYFLLPFFRCLIEDRRALAVAMAVVFVWCFLVQTYNRDAPALGLPVLSSNGLGSYLPLGTYGFYVAVGALTAGAISHRAAPAENAAGGGRSLADAAGRIPVAVLALAFFAALLVGFAEVWAVGSIWYGNVSTLVASVALWLLLLRAPCPGRGTRASSALAWASGTSFCVYFTHWLALYSLPFLPWCWDGWMPASVLKAFVLDLACAYVAAALLWLLTARLPRARGLAFHAG